MSQTYGQPRALDAGAKRAAGALAVLLGLGGVDLAVLNVLVLPALLTATDMSPARRPRDAAADSTAAQAARAAVPAATPSAAIRSAPEHANDSVERRAPPPSASGAARVLILFGTGNWWIGPQGRHALSESLGDLTQTQAVIEVVGHADSPGTRAFNQHLSEMRAQAVKAMLIEDGVDALRIRTRGVGEDEPSPDGRDRKVEIRIGGTP